MKTRIQALTLGLALMLMTAEAASAGWVWLYGGHKYFVADPRLEDGERGKYADQDGDGRLDAIIHRLTLRVCDETGKDRERILPGEVVVFSAAPEFGADAADSLELKLEVLGPAGALPLKLDPAAAAAKTAGQAPPVFRASYRVPIDLSPRLGGSYVFTASLRIGKVTAPRGVAKPVKFRLMARGQKDRSEALPYRLSGGLKHLGHEVLKFGGRLFRNLVPGGKSEAEPASLKPLSGSEAEDRAEAALKLEDVPWSARHDQFRAAGACGLKNRIRPPNALLVIPAAKLLEDREQWGEAATFWAGWILAQDVGLALGPNSLEDAAWVSVQVDRIEYDCVPLAVEFPQNEPLSVNVLVPAKQGSKEPWIRTQGRLTVRQAKDKPARATLEVVQRSAASYEVVAQLGLHFVRDDQAVEVSLPIVIDLLEPREGA